MQHRYFRASVAAAMALTGSALLQPALAAPAAAMQDVTASAGMRGGAGDPDAIVIEAKVKLADLGAFTLSTRPALLLGETANEWRLPVTFELHPYGPGVSFFGGGGLAYGTDGLGNVDAMLSGGVDIRSHKRWIVTLGVNVIWQRAVADTDKEFMATMGYGF